MLGRKEVVEPRLGTSTTGGVDEVRGREARVSEGRRLGEAAGAVEAGNINVGVVVRVETGCGAGVLNLRNWKRG